MYNHDKENVAEALGFTKTVFNEQMQKAIASFTKDNCLSKGVENLLNDMDIRDEIKLFACFCAGQMAGCPHKGECDEQNKR